MTSQKGFTLVEMAIVLVVIGLIVSGIVVGQSLINSSKLRAVVADVNELRAAIEAFRLRYDALPGDIRNASDYWAGAVNGVQNGIIQSGVPGSWSEANNVYHHLSRAGLIPGNYAAVGTAGAAYLVAGVSSPRSPVNNNVYQVMGWHTAIYNVPANTRNMIWFGNPVTAWPGVGGLPVQDAGSIDEKIDDGVAGRGSVVSGSGLRPGEACATVTGDNAAYNYATSPSNCSLGFYLE